jgi:hypothetical protein
MLISPITVYVPEQPPLSEPSAYSDAKESENHEKHSANFSGGNEGDDSEGGKPDRKHQQHRSKGTLSTRSGTVTTRLAGRLIYPPQDWVAKFLFALRKVLWARITCSDRITSDCGIKQPIRTILLKGAPMAGEHL